MAPHKIV